MSIGHILINYIMNNKYYNFSSSIFLKYFTLNIVILSSIDVKGTPPELNVVLFWHSLFHNVQV